VQDRLAAQRRRHTCRIDRNGQGFTVTRTFWRTALICSWCLFVAATQPASAQTEGEDTGGGTEEPDVGGARMTRDEAIQALAQALPGEPAARYVALQRQFRAAQLLENRPQQIELSRQLVDAGRGRPGGEAWIRVYLNAEFTWGSSGKALEACEPFVTDTRLSLDTRATAALRQTYYQAQGNDRAILARLWSRADALARQALEQPGAATSRLAVDRLQVRAEVERMSGNSLAAVATLRESVGLGRRALREARSRSTGPRDPDVLDAYGWVDGSLGMLVYALVQQGRAPEATEIGRANIAQWKAGQLSEGLGARWNYRLATSLVATQQYEEGLAAAQLSDQMLERSGASTASHTRWLARQEIVRSLMGLKRWKEADESYRSFLAAMPPDVLARTRASDSRLLALLAAKNGRMEEALEAAERIHRFRLRLYGANHPQTQESAGVRAVVHLLRGEQSAAMADYESLFNATLDTPGGWLDLDARGLRGFVLGLAFDEFLVYVTERTLKGERVDAALTDRALQIADRMSIGVTQRALTDSTARVLAATPALAALLEQEQQQRAAVAAAFSKLGASLADEDRLRREAQTEAFKARPEPERKAHTERQRAQREQTKALQAEAASAREALEARRAAIARQFPAYADLVMPTTARPEQLRRLLGGGEALAVVHATDEATLVWLLAADGTGGFAVSRLTKKDLAQRVAELRRMLDVGALPASQRPPLQVAAFHALYRDLFGTLQEPLRKVRALVLASSGPLAGFPASTFVTEPPAADAPTAWLVRQMAVTQVPSPAALQALRRVSRPGVAAQAMVGFGDPLFALGGGTAAPASGVRGAPQGQKAGRYDAEWGFRYADVPPLPETRAELTAVAQAVGADAARDLVLGARATRQAVLAANLSDRRLVAFATHGLMPGELPGISKPALAMAADADERESPLLELDDVLSLRLNAQWVLLSACNTAAGEQGGAAMSGLVRGFFFAGARSVLATHWAVETESAAALSVATFSAHAQGGVSRAEALRKAQLALIEGRAGGGRWTHPFYWAPYALFGDPER
jgi:CHAT domain-containing protein